MKSPALGGCRLWLSAGVTAALLAGCGGSQTPSGAPATVPQFFAASSAHASVHGILAPDSARNGIYASEDSSSGPNVFGYHTNDRGNEPAICSNSVTDAYGLAVDQKGNLIVPGQFYYVTVFAGPGMCGPEAGSFAPGTWAVDAASANAINGTIALAVYIYGSGFGGILLCTLKGGCTTLLQSKNMYSVLGVALAKNGDCWGSSQESGTSGGAAILTYFKGCAEPGETATGYENQYDGGLDIDRHGNLVAISWATPSIYVYSGCDPACKRVGGPFSLQGGAVYGHLNKDSTAFVTGDYQYGQVDIYKYAPKAITYKYSFNNGLFTSSRVDVVGAAYDPRSKE